MPLRNTIALCIISLFFGLLPGMQASGQVTEAEKMFIGNWEGALEIPGVQLRLRFTIREDSSRGLVATLASLDQGARDLPIDSVIVDGTRIRLVLPQISGSYEAELAMMNLQLQGEWEQMGRSMPLTVLRAEEPAKTTPDARAAVPVSGRGRDDRKYRGWRDIGGHANDAILRSRASCRGARVRVWTSRSRFRNHATSAIPGAGGLPDPPGNSSPAV